MLATIEQPFRLQQNNYHTSYNRGTIILVTIEQPSYQLQQNNYYAGYNRTTIMLYTIDTGYNRTTIMLDTIEQLLCWLQNNYDAGYRTTIMLATIGQPLCWVQQKQNNHYGGYNVSFLKRRTQNSLYPQDFNAFKDQIELHGSIKENTGLFRTLQHC